MGILYTSSVRTVLCKECPLTELHVAYCIIEFNYGERFCHVFKYKVLAEGGIFEPDMAWYNVL